MLAMILQRPESDKKIHLCAPSNSAVDEILLRIMNKGLIGIPNDKLQQMIIRVGASNYKAPDDLKSLDIKSKIQKFANKEAELRLYTEI